MERKNPVRAFASVASLPESPTPGMARHIAGIGSFVWDGSRWCGIDGATYFHTAGAGLLVREPVVVLAGTATRCNALVHARVTGVCIGLLGGLAAVRYGGLVSGFAGLVGGARYHVGEAAGVLTRGAISENATLLPVGVAVSDTELFVRTGPEVPG